jgi:hypothetical protein
MPQPGPKGEFALTDVETVEIVEVLQGDLKLKRLIEVVLPDGLKKGTYTFRWKLSHADRQAVRAAEREGSTGIWIGANLELVNP